MGICAAPAVMLPVCSCLRPSIYRKKASIVQGVAGPCVAWLGQALANGAGSMRLSLSPPLNLFLSQSSISCTAFQHSTRCTVTARPASDVSLYWLCMSRPVVRMVSIA